MTMYLWCYIKSYNIDDVVGIRIGKLRNTFKVNHDNNNMYLIWHSAEYQLKDLLWNFIINTYNKVVGKIYYTDRS